MVKKDNVEGVKDLNKYDPSRIELNWQSKWEKEGVYQPDLVNAKRPFYNLMMFPYPSAEGLHVGSVFAFSGVDVYGRFKRMQGNDVFEPIGLDGFGIHSENHAIKTGTHPMEHAKRTEGNFYRQLSEIGNGFAWMNKLETYDPDYYRWTQWIFIQLFKAGLAYRKKAEVNWCPSCKTVLADEQVIETRLSGGQGNKEKGGVDIEVHLCERCDTEIEKRELEQWFFRITKYADRLLTNLEGLDWSEKVKIAQRNWIGKSEGARVGFGVKESDLKIEVFTTRPDTLYGVTFLVLSPEHEIVKGIESREVIDYVARAKMISEKERLAEEKEKTGVFSGLYAINPVNGEEIPVWIADYVLVGYGTGAIMAVPAHDSRDFEFAQKYNLPVRKVIVTEDEDGRKGKLEKSGDWDGWEVPRDIHKVIGWLDKRGIGKVEVNYHLRDWLISRQRYWGPPIPMVFCEDCAKKGKGWFDTKEANGEEWTGLLPHKGTTYFVGSRRFALRNDSEGWDAAGWYPVEDDSLPVELPFLEDYKPIGTGKSPLANAPDFYRTKCPRCGSSEARRETDVSDNFLDNSWYFFRYLSNDRDDVGFDIDIVKKWLPVNMYIGGAEHAVLHLLYARFITMVLKDAGYVDFEEPFTKFYSHGLIVKDGAKMSKSKGNVINPDDYIRKYGADTLRMYLHFLGPFDEGGDFRDTGIEGMYRFVKRVWRLFGEVDDKKKLVDEDLRMMHMTIKGVSEDMEGLRYNRAIAKLMTWYNYLSKDSLESGVSKEEAEVYLKLLAPFAPHMTEELWQRMKVSDDKAFNSIHVSSWPEFEEKYLKQEIVVLAVQVNGKMRDTIEVQREKSKEQSEIEGLARASEKVKSYLDGKKVIKVIHVPGKVINFVLYG